MLLLLLAALSASDYTGRYQQSDGNVVYVTQQKGTLIVRPLFWRATQELVPDGEDRFHSRERPERKALFTRDEKGRVVSLTMNGIGHDAPMPRLTHERRVPAELLMHGKPREAAKAVAPEVAIAWGEFLARALPSKSNDAATFVQAVAKKHPSNTKLRQVEGSLLLAAGRRTEAKQAFAAAGDEVSLRMMAPSPELDALFAKPTREEIETVLARWAKRDLAPRGVQLVHRGTLGDAEVRILSHRVHGSLHYGAVIVPHVATGFSPSRPVVVEAKGVSPSYFPLDVARAYAPDILGKDFIYLLPSYRGEVLQFDGRSWTSEGDRTDVWDGATDDFIAFTAAALSVTPEADGERVCAFGKSRGGAVALLAGIRDRRFDCVAAWAAPTDHFFEMVQSGWTPRERAAEGLRVKSDVFGIGGQFLETFLARPRSVAEQRLHLIASSPLWFAERLPATQAHYGLDDNMVSVRNGRALASRNGKVEMVFHEEAGHDLDKEKAYRETARFLARQLLNAGQAAACHRPREGQAEARPTS
ncbi:MAG TPA: prolyl oligopeptidase family serine peptidase [Thermoanaerobaculia bacterium]